MFPRNCCPWLTVCLAGLILATMLIASVYAVTLGTEPQQISKNEKRQIAGLQRLAKQLKPLHAQMGKIQPGDWLESHKENGQTFQQYWRSQPVQLTDDRNILYVLPLGEFDENQRKIIDLSAEFLGLYFDCETSTMETLSLDEAIPAEARRVHPSWGVRQIKSTFVLDKVLRPRLPDDAAALIAFTSSDLYPDDNWNFVFGQATLRHRVGVWSIYRNGDPDTEYQLCLKRTLQTATHETGHMFSIAHCTKYECNMCGSNNRAESDRRPLYLCPECVPKIWWSTKCDPETRFENLIEFCTQNGLADEVSFYTKSLEAIKPKK